LILCARAARSLRVAGLTYFLWPLGVVAFRVAADDVDFFFDDAVPGFFADGFVDFLAAEPVPELFFAV
jgi:hypothetical protein